jgi:hypothetical protein
MHDSMEIFLGLDYAKFANESTEAPGKCPTPISIAVSDFNTDNISVVKNDTDYVEIVLRSC